MNVQRKEYRTQIRFPADVWDALKQLAKAHDRSLNGEVIHGLRLYLQNQIKGNKNDHKPQDQD
jgi:Arc-like DNA binding dprotein